MATAVSSRTMIRYAGSYADYLALPDMALITEWVEEEIFIHMPPSDQHQDLSGFLFN